MVSLLVNLISKSTQTDCTAVIIGFHNTKYSVDEGDPAVTLTVGVRGGKNRCNKTEWMLYYSIRNVSAQCE